MKLCRPKGLQPKRIYSDGYICKRHISYWFFKYSSFKELIEGNNIYVAEITNKYKCSVEYLKNNIRFFIDIIKNYDVEHPLYKGYVMVVLSQWFRKNFKRFRPLTKSDIIYIEDREEQKNAFFVLHDNKPILVKEKINTGKLGGAVEYYSDGNEIVHLGCDWEKAMIDECDW